MRHIQSISILVFLTIGWVSCPIHGQAADFPNKPITLVVPYPAGGATDLVIRPLAEAAKKYLGQPVIVENRSGGGGAVGVGSIVGKKPDGYLLSVVVTSLHRNSYINKLSFDTVKDVTPVIQLAGYLYGILVRSDSQFKTLKELLDYAESQPGKDQLHGFRPRDGGHIAMEELAYNAGGIKFNHIPSKGDPESTAALFGRPYRRHLHHLGLDSPSRGREAQASGDLRREEDEEVSECPHRG